MASRTGLSSTGSTPRTAPLPSMSSLTRQPSIYTLTLEELQNTVQAPSKNLGSMNMDEFLKNIWTAEESQAMAAAMSGVGEGNGAVNGSAAGSLPRQGSMSLPRNLEGKTVDEVWTEIHRSSERNATDNVQQRQMTWGEITLEDFLAKAGVARDESEAGASASSCSSVVTQNTGMVEKLQQSSAAEPQTARQAPPQQLDWMNYQVKTGSAALLLQQQHLLHQQQQAEAAAAAAFAGRPAHLPSSTIGFPPPAATTATSVLDVPFDSSVGLAPSSLSPSRALITPDTPTRGKKRPFELHEEKWVEVEQRQRRMIKNRESAARSRARKQAYTVELEAEVTQLKEENAKLMQQQAEAIEKRRKQLMETLIPVTSQSPRPVRLLRRTQTASW